MKATDSTYVCKVSVLMPAYNAEKYIGEAIESILNQTLTDFEFIIIDDCSTDKTWEIIQEYAKKDMRIVALRNEKNLKLSLTLNKGINFCHTKYIARMDDDDYSYPNRLEKQFNFMENNPEIAVVGAWIQIMDENGQEVRVRKYLPDDKGLRGKMFRYSPVAHPVVMYKKKVVQEFGCYLPEYSPAEDLNLWFKIGTKYKFANIQEVLLKYRFFEKSSSNKKLREVEIKTLKMHWHAWRYQGYKPSFSDILYNTCQFLTIYLMPIKWRINFFNIIRKYL